jgi:4-amino-4-deoxy-L-arabinose transferase-like glycosyltransferase
MFNSIKRNLIILAIISVAFVLRFSNVVNNPPALTWDEVSIGYNAYSILKTGKDEHGKFLPLDTFISYGDYKPTLPIYITVPCIAIFGLNELSVRLPSVIFGTLSVYLTYILTVLLFNEFGNFRKNSLIKIPTLGYITATLLTFSPWHINISRAGFEANIALFLVILGTYLLVKIRSIPKLWIYAFLPYVGAAYTFNSARYFVLFITLFLLYLSLQSIKNNIKYFIIGVIIAAVIILPLVPHLLSNESRLRFKEVNIFSDSSVVITSNNRIAFEGNTIIAKIVNNRRIAYARSFFIHFLDNLEPSFLFIKGDGNPKFSTQDVGQLYLIEAPFLILGLLWLFSECPILAGFLLYWMLTAIIPAATARETPHALRILNTLPVWQIFIAYGIYQSVIRLHNISKFPKSAIFKNLIYAVILGIYILNVSYYLYNYHVHYPREFSGEWQYGYKQGIEYAQGVDSQYDHIYVSESIGRAYMYTLFYTQYDPQKFLNTKKSYFDADGFYHVDGFGKWIFIKTMPQKVLPNNLIIGNTNWNSPNDKVLHTVKLLNGDPVLNIFSRS